MIQSSPARLAVRCVALAVVLAVCWVVSLADGNTWQENLLPTATVITTWGFVSWRARRVDRLAGDGRP